MMRVKSCFRPFVVCAFLVANGSFSSSIAQTLKPVAKFDLPGPGGKRFDYLTIDADDHYLISAHLAADQTYVIDTRTNKVVATVSDTPGAEGVEYVPVVARYPVGRCKGNHGMTLDPEHHRAFLSCEGNDLMTVFDLDKYQPVAFLPMASGPDVIKFDPGLGRIYVACYSGAISVFHQDDPDRYRKLEDFKVQHAVHSLAVNPETHRLYAPEQEVDGKPAARMAV